MTEIACPGAKVPATVHRDGYKNRPDYYHCVMLLKNWYFLLSLWTQYPCICPILWVARASAVWLIICVFTLFSEKEKKKKKPNVWEKSLSFVFYARLVFDDVAAREHSCFPAWKFCFAHSITITNNLCSLRLYELINKYDHTLTDQGIVSWTFTKR